MDTHTLTLTLTLTLTHKEKEDWEYPDHRVLLIECGLFPMETYIERRKETLK